MKTIIMLTALLALSLSPASARFDGDEDGSSAYPIRDNNGRGVWIGNYRIADGVFVNRPQR